jgi:hypothetical protein
MTDLIWIGNTLYPRWVVFAAIGLVVLTFAGISAFVSRGKP